MHDDATTATSKSIWDNLPVEVSAAFHPIKLPLQQLKEIEKGLVIEVGNVMDNQIQIEVDGQAVAWGELIIIGDKFGVRIQGIYDAPQTGTPTMQMTAQMAAKSSEIPTLSSGTESVATDPTNTPIAEESDPFGMADDFGDLDDDDDDWN